MIDEGEEEQGGTLYGTSINIRKAMISVEKFVLLFEVNGEQFYRNQLINMAEMENTIFEVDGRHLLAANN